MIAYECELGMGALNLMLRLLWFQDRSKRYGGMEPLCSHQLANDPFIVNNLEEFK